MITSPRVARACLTATLLAGCAGAPRSDPMAAALSERHVDYQIPMNTAVFLDEGLQKAVSVENTSAGRSPSNSLTVAATLRNRSDDQMKLSARTQFFGANKQMLESTGWTHLFLDRRAIGSYETAATNPGAAFYHIELAYGR